MKEFNLRGLAEGLVGYSKVTAHSVNEVFSLYPQLQDVKYKLTVSGNTIQGFSACDG